MFQQCTGQSRQAWSFLGLWCASGWQMTAYSTFFSLCKHMLALMFHRCNVSNAFIQPGDQLLLASKTIDSSGPPITRVSFPLCLPHGNAEVFTRQSFDGKSNILISWV